MNDDDESVLELSWRIINEDLGTRRIAAKMVPRILTAEQKQARVETCQELKQQLDIDPDMFSKVITGDETWCYAYEPETKQQSSQWKHPGSV